MKEITFEYEDIPLDDPRFFDHKEQHLAKWINADGETITVIRSKDAKTFRIFKKVIA